MVACYNGGFGIEPNQALNPKQNEGNGTTSSPAVDGTRKEPVYDLRRLTRHHAHSSLADRTSVRNGLMRLADIFWRHWIYWRLLFALNYEIKNEFNNDHGVQQHVEELFEREQFKL